MSSEDQVVIEKIDAQQKSTSCLKVKKLDLKKLKESPKPGCVNVHGVDCPVPIVPSPHDSRDWIVENLDSTKQRVRSRSEKKVGNDQLVLPETLDLRKFLNPPRNQGTRGTCAAFSAGCVKEYQERIDINYRNYMSPESVYYFRTTGGEGMYVRNLMKILHEKGMAPEPYFPYGDSEPTEFPPEAMASMKNYRIKSYARVTTIEGAKKALFLYGPLIIAVPTYHNRPEIWKPKNENDQMVGGHAMAIVGYDQKGFIIRNSWGRTWNFDGYVTFPYSDWGLQWEIWSSIDAESPKLPPDWDKKNPKPWWLCC